MKLLIFVIDNVLLRLQSWNNIDTAGDIHLHLLDLTLYFFVQIFIVLIVLIVFICLDLRWLQAHLSEYKSDHFSVKSACIDELLMHHGLQLEVSIYHTHAGVRHGKIKDEAVIISSHVSVVALISNVCGFRIANHLYEFKACLLCGNVESSTMLLFVIDRAGYHSQDLKIWWDWAISSIGLL